MHRHDRHLIGYYIPSAAAAAAGLLLILAGVIKYGSIPGAIVLFLLIPAAAAGGITWMLVRSRQALADAGVLLKNPGTLAEAAGLSGVVLDYERTVTRGRRRVLKVLAAGAVGKRGLRAREENDALLELAAAEAVRKQASEQRTEQAFRRETAEQRQASEQIAGADSRTEAENSGSAQDVREDSVWQCIRRAWGSDPDPRVLEGHRVLLGDADLLRSAAIPIIPAKEPGEVIYVAVDDKFHGYLVIGDPARAEAAEAVEELRSAGIQEIAVLAGEDQKGAEAFAAGNGIDEVLSEAEEGLAGILREWKERCGGTIGLVSGREALAAVRGEAAVTFAMGRKGGGTRQAVRAADIVLRTGDLRGAGLTIAEGRHTTMLVRRIGYGSLLLEIAVLVLRFVGVL